MLLLWHGTITSAHSWCTCFLPSYPYIHTDWKTFHWVQARNMFLVHNGDENSTVNQRADFFSMYMNIYQVGALYKKYFVLWSRWIVIRRVYQPSCSPLNMRLVYSVGSVHLGISRYHNCWQVAQYITYAFIFCSIPLLCCLTFEAGHDTACLPTVPA